MVVREVKLVPSSAPPQNMLRRRYPWASRNDPTGTSSGNNASGGIACRSQGGNDGDGLQRDTEPRPVVKTHMSLVYGQGMTGAITLGAPA